MRLKFEIPFNFNLEGPNSDSLDLKTSFDHKGLIVMVELIGRVPNLQPAISGDVVYSKQITGISFEITDNDTTNPQLSNLLNEPLNCFQLIKYLLPIINRVLRAIRNLGFVYSVYELNPSEIKARYLISLWNIQFLTSIGDWKKIIEPSKGILGSIIDSMDPEYQHDYLNVTSWMDIEEAIQDDLETPPEYEFIGNSIQHLKQRNFRVALVESIICLEIVLTQFLNEFLKVSKKIPKERIKNFLVPHFSLNSRVSGLLDLVLDPEDLKQVDLDSVLIAIKWRNDVIHKKGKLRANLSDNDIIEKIVSVLKLASLLSNKRDQINNSPMLQELGYLLSHKFNLPNPNIKKIKHQVVIDFDFLDFQLPAEQENLLISIEREVSSFLTPKDQRFNASEHLIVRFVDILNGVKARWRSCKTELF